MFHVHQDRRTQRSATKIAKSLSELIKQKDFQEITIADVQRSTGIARTTFYRSFDNLIDVLEWECDYHFNHLFLQYRGLQQFPTERRILADYLDYWSQHNEILTVLVKIKRVDIIQTCQQKYAEEMVKEYGPVDKYSSIPLNYFLAVRMNFVLSIVLTWVASGKQETVEQLQTIAEKQIQQLAVEFIN